MPSVEAASLKIRQSAVALQQRLPKSRFRAPQTAPKRQVAILRLGGRNRTVIAIGGATHPSLAPATRGLKMKNSTKLFLGAVSLAGVMTAAAPAFAQDAPAWALNGTVAVTSDYKFRGISQGERNFAPQGSLTVSGPEGFYVSAWASQVDFTPGGSNAPEVELDIYGGKHTDLWGVDWNFMPYYYSYPSEPGGYNADYFELINQLTKAVGPATFTA